MADERVIIPIELTVTDIKTSDVNLKEVQKSIESRLAGIAKSASDVLGKVDTSKLNKTLTSAMDNVTTSYQKLALAQSQVNEALRSAGSSSPKFKKELQSIQDEIDKTEKNWEEFADLLLQNPILQRGLNKRDMGLSLDKSEFDAIKFFEEAANKYETTMADLQNRMPDPSKFLSTATTTELQKIVKSYYDVFNAVKKVETATENWNNAKSANTMTDEYTAKIKELETLEKKLISVKEKSEKMSSVGATDRSWKTLQYDATLLEQKIVQIIHSMQDMVKTGNAFRFGTGDSQKELDALSSKLANVSNVMRQVKGSSGGIKAGILSLVKSVNNFGKSTEKSLGTVISMFRKLGKTSQHTSKDVSKSFKKMWKDILMFGFGVRSTFFLIRRLRNIFIKSFQDMAGQIPEVNEDISSFVTSLNQLKGSLATAFQPIVSAIIPWLNQLIAALSRAMTVLAKFFATLTGQGYIYKFTAAQVDYAKSLEKTGAAAKKAQKSLMGFDEINRLDDNSDSGGGGGEIPTGTWEKEMLDGANKFAQMLKDAWGKGDFYDVGKFLGEKLLEALKIADDWIVTKGYALAEKIGRSLGTLINGLVEVEGLGAQIGKTIADALNMAMIGLNTFLTTTNWLNVGQFIADWANASIKNFKWDLLGQLVANFITAGVNMWWKFVGAFDFSGLGSGIATALNNLFSNLLAKDDTGLSTAQKLGQAITNTVRGILNTLTTAINETDWSAVGQTIGEVLGSIDWSGIIWDFTKLVGAVVKGIAEAFMSWTATDPISAAIAALIGIALIGVKILPTMISVVTFGSKLVEVFKLVAGGAGTLKEALSVVFGTASTVFAGIVSVVSGVVLAFTNFFSMLKNGFSWLKEILMVIGIALAAVGAVILGAPALIAAVIAAIVAAVMTAIVVIKDNWQAICDFFANLWEWLKTTISNGLTAISNWWNTTWTAIKIFFANMWTAILTTLTNIFTNIKNFITNTLNNIKTFWTTMWTAIKTTTSNIWTGIKTTISNAITGVKTTVSNILNNIKTAWSNAWNNMKTIVTNIWNGIKNTIRNTINGIIGSINGMIRGIVNGINSVARALNGLSFTIPSWVPGLGGNSFGLNVPTISAPQIPYLAKGAVIPPNKEFMAMLGDQKHGTNIEAPLDTIKQAVAEELAEYIDAMMTGFQAVVDAVNDKDFDVNIGDNAIGKAAERYRKRQALVRGTT